MRENVSLNSQYQAVLADLQQMKADAEDGIRAIKRLLSRSAAVSPVATETPDNAGSLPNRVVTFLESRQGRSFKIGEVAQSFPGENIKTLRGVLARLYKEEKIGKHGRGRYRSHRERSVGDKA